MFELDKYLGAGIHGIGMAINFISTLTLMTQVAEAKSPGIAREQVHKKRFIC